MSFNIKIEKLCEYLVNIGLLNVDDLNSFLKINSQISQNKFNDKEQLILTLFSYLASVSKNEQQLYDISRNIIESFLSRQAIIGQLTKKINTQIEDELDKNNQLLRSANNYNSMDRRNFNIFPMKKGKSARKNNFNNMNNDNIYFEEGKEFTFSPKINRPKSNRIRNSNNRYPSRYDIDYDGNIFNKNIKTKNKNLYNDNIISNEIDKLYDYYSRQNIRKNFNSPNYNIFNIHDFYQKEQNHVRKVEDKIMKLTMKQLKELEQACTFSPKVHEIPDYIIKNKINSSYFGTYDNNYYNINNIKYINDLPYQNDKIQNMKININKIIDDYAMDYYDIPLNNTKKNKKGSSSASKEISFGGNLSDKKSEGNNNVPVRPNFSFSDKEKEENDMKLLNDLQKRFRIPVGATAKNNANSSPTQKRNSTNSKSKNSINKDKKSEDNKSKTSSNKPNGDKESKNSISNQSQKEGNEKNDENDKEQNEKKDNDEDNNISSNKTDNNNEKNNTSSNKADNEKDNKSLNKTDNERSKKSSIKTDNEKSKKSSIKTDNNNEKNNSTIKTDNNNEKNDNSASINKTNTKKSDNSASINKTNTKKSNNSASINKTNTKKSNTSSSVNKTNNEKNNNNSKNSKKESNNISSNKTEDKKIVKDNNSSVKTESIKEEKTTIKETKTEIKNGKKISSVEEKITTKKEINKSQNSNNEANNLPLLNEQIKIEVRTNKEETSIPNNNKNNNEEEKEDKNNENNEIQSSEGNMKESAESNKDNNGINGEEKKFETIQDIISSQ